MSYILTLVSAQDMTVHEQIEVHVKITKPWTWLAQNKAIETTLEMQPKPATIEAIRQICDPYKTDILITLNHKRRKKLLFADMDSTIVQGETLDELAAHAGLKEKIATITTRAMNGEIDFHEAIKERVSLLKDLSANMIEKTLKHTTLNKGAHSLVKTMKKSGATCVLVSGGFTFFTQAIAAEVDFNHHHGNHLEIQNNKLTGKVIEPILDKDAKLTLLNNYVRKQSIEISDSLTIGDGANDLPMLRKAHEADGLGIGYHPKPNVAEQLTNIIRHTDLTTALYAQGYKENEII